MKKNSEPVAFIILNYRTPEETVECVRSVLALSYEPKKIIIVDNNSNDGSVEKIEASLNDENEVQVIYRKDAQEGRKTDSKIVIIANDENRGYSAGNNLGIDYALSQGIIYGFILNPDTRIVTDNVEEGISFLQENEKILILVPLIVDNDFSEQPLLPPETCRFITNILKIFFGKFLSKSPEVSHREFSQIEKPHGCCMLIDLKNFRAIGLFDENLFLSGEESVIQFVTQRSGFKIIFYSKIKVKHLHKKSHSIQKGYRNFMESKKYIFANYCSWKRWQISIWQFFLEVYVLMLSLVERFKISLIE